MYGHCAKYALFNELLIFFISNFTFKFYAKLPNQCHYQSIYS